MRHVVLVLSLVLASCSTITDNIQVDTDAIIASTCQQLADGLSNQLTEAVAAFESTSDVELPEVDISGLIDRAETLGCSPDDMREIIASAIDEVETTSEAAQSWLADLQAVTD